MMTPTQKIKATILYKAADRGDFKLDKEITEDTVDTLYDECLVDEGIHYDYELDMRGGDVETNLPSQLTRYYETEEVASQMYDGSWVGWTYYYGGGKHSNPECIDWMSEAYNLEMKEHQELVTIKTFTKI